MTLKATIVPPGSDWQTLSLNANYQAFGGGFQTPQFKRAGRWIYVRGVVTRNTSTAAAGSFCGTLPAGFRPLVTAMFEQHLSGTRVRVDVSSTGQILHQDGAVTVGGYLSLDGIFFAID